MTDDRHARDAPAWLRSYVTREERFVHGPASWSLTLPASSEDLFDAEAFESDERLPYWADLWPSAKRFARFILDGGCPEARDGRRVLELGSGIALVSLALRAVGADALATDYEASALRFAEWNAERNGLAPLRTRTLDWRDPAAELASPLVVAADVLYERRNAESLASLLPQVVAPGGRALLADPRRPWRAHLMERLGERGFEVVERPLGPELGPGGKEVEIVLLECRRPAPR